MQRRRWSSWLVTLALAIAVTGCAAPAPTAAPGSPAPAVHTAPADGTTSPTPTLVPGSTALRVTGVLFEPCIPPPSGCAYDVTLLGPGGAAATVSLDYPAEYHAQSEGVRTPMTPAPGLPPSLAPGSYTIVFQSFEWRDDATPVPLPSGGTGYPPVVREGCRRSFAVKATDARISLKATWHADTCTVKLTRT